MLFHPLKLAVCIYLEEIASVRLWGQSRKTEVRPPADGTVLVHTAGTSSLPQ